MATVYRCDRCSRETNDYDNFFNIQMPLEYDKTSKTNHDLCTECLLYIRRELSPITQTKSRA